MTLCCTNARSIKNKIFDVKNFLDCGDETDILCVTETWLSSDDVFDLPNYTCFRFDRTAKKGGGCMILLKNCITCEVVNLNFSPKEIEILCVDFQVIKAQKVRLICVYSPPVCNRMQFDELSQALTFFLQDSSLPVIVTGDMNLPDVDWINAFSPSAHFQDEILGLLSALGLQQRVCEPTLHTR